MEHETDARRDGELTLGDYLAVMRRHWRGILLITTLATAMAFGWYLVQPRQYAAEASGVVITVGGDNLSLSLAGDNLAKSRAKNYKSVAESALVAERVARDLGLERSPQDLASAVTVTVPVDTTEIRVSAKSTDPSEAQRVADAWISALSAQVSEIERSAGQTGLPPVRVVTLSRAVLPTEPVSPNIRLTLGVGVVGGLLLGFAYAMVRNHVDRRIRTAAEVERQFAVPVLGTLPVDHDFGPQAEVIEADQWGSPLGEAFRELRTNLQFVDVDQPPRVILVTSAMPSEGKSAVVANLAAGMVAAGEKVVVVDCDLRRPMVDKVFDLVPGVGVTDVLSGRADIEDVRQGWTGSENLTLLGSGRIPPNPAELLGSRAMQALLRRLAEDAIVLVDAPPLLPVTDAAVLSRAVDGTLVVARAGQTTTDQLERAFGNLSRVNGRILGVVLNCVPTAGPESSAYSYYGTYGEDARGGRTKGRRPSAKRRPSRTPRPAVHATDAELHEPAPASRPLAEAPYEPAYRPAAVPGHYADRQDRHAPSSGGQGQLAGANETFDEDGLADDLWLPAQLRDQRGRRSAG
ncbi:polysaccharide biosynthesis tyrosine autokinase [Sinomonas flava]|uniref:polysaccharide biosynthesis tyrosine autokinase n=1 Tax=Sinomonas flava TaxID=496857 RepID=UPI0039A47BE2